MNGDHPEQTKSVTPAAAGKAREKRIIRASATGILANILLAVFKALVGTFCHSIAIVLDAVNNLSDAASSVITIIGTKLAGKEPDWKHPFGHGRIEYLSALIIAMIVLYAGITSLIESVRKILSPQTPSYTGVSLLIIAVAVAVKILLGRYVRREGEETKSDALVNSGKDAMLDAVISAATLAAAAVFLLTGVSLEAYLAAVISAVIIRSGVGMLRNTLSEILGERVDARLTRDIKETVCSFPEVTGAYDLVLNNYGPEKYIGSVHVEVPDTYTAGQLDELLRAIQVRVYQEHHVILSAIGVYSVNTRDEEAVRIREEIRELVTSHEHVLQMHGFYLNREKRVMRFDIIVGFAAKDRHGVYQEVVEDVQARYPEYTLMVAMDTDFSEPEPESPEPLK